MLALQESRLPLAPVLQCERHHLEAAALALAPPEPRPPVTPLDSSTARPVTLPVLGVAQLITGRPRCAHLMFPAAILPAGAVAAHGVVVSLPEQGPAPPTPAGEQRGQECQSHVFTRWE